MNEKRITKKNTKEYMTILAIMVIFLLLIYIRFSWFHLHFTHYDDIKVDQFTNYKYDCFKDKFSFIAARGGVWSSIFNICYLLFGSTYNWVAHAINFSKYWHYAPGQYIMTFAFLPKAWNYDSVKFFGRLPSLIMGIGALIYCYKVSKRVTESKVHGIFATIIVGLSWQSIIYCMNMGNYESIILFGFIGALFVVKASEKDKLSIWIRYAALIGVMSWFQYQALCIFGGFALALLVNNIRKKMMLDRNVRRIIAICVFYAIVVVPLLTFAYMEGGPTWNVGPNGEYLFKFGNGIVYFFKFFVINSGKVFKAMLSPVPLSAGISNVIAGALLIFFLIGVYASLFGKEKKQSEFIVSVYSIGVLLTEYFFILLGKFTLSPTRHNNILIPVYVIEILLGVYYISFKYMKAKFRYVLPVGLSLFLAISFASCYREVKNQRLDPFTETSVNAMIQENKPDLIIDCTAPQMWYLLGSEYTRREIIDYQTDFYDLDYDPENNYTIMIISHAWKVDQSTIDYVKQALVEKGYLSQDRVDQMLKNGPVKEENQWGSQDFDFYNVTNGTSNGLYYNIYKVE